jgi:hypothetical protein
LHPAAPLLLLLILPLCLAPLLRRVPLASSFHGHSRHTHLVCPLPYILPLTPSPWETMPPRISECRLRIHCRSTGCNEAFLGNGVAGCSPGLPSSIIVTCWSVRMNHNQTGPCYVCEPPQIVYWCCDLWIKPRNVAQASPCHRCISTFPLARSELRRSLTVTRIQLSLRYTTDDLCRISAATDFTRPRGRSI